MVDYLRIAGVPPSSIRVLTVLDQPWQNYEYLTAVSQVPRWRRLRSDSSSCPDNIWAFPSYAVREAFAARNRGTSSPRCGTCSPRTSCATTGRPSRRPVPRHAARSRPDRLLGERHAGQVLMTHRRARWRLLHLVMPRDGPGALPRLPEPLRAFRRWLSRSALPGRPAGLPIDRPVTITGWSTPTNHTSTCTTSCIAGAAPSWSGGRDRRVADPRPTDLRPRPLGRQDPDRPPAAHLRRRSPRSLDVHAPPGRPRLGLSGLQLAQVDLGRPGQGPVDASSRARTEPTSSGHMGGTTTARRKNWQRQLDGAGPRASTRCTRARWTACRAWPVRNGRHPPARP